MRQAKELRHYQRGGPPDDDALDYPHPSLYMNHFLHLVRFGSDADFRSAFSRFQVGVLVLPLLLPPPPLLLLLLQLALVLVLVLALVLRLWCWRWCWR